MKIVFLGDVFGKPGRQVVLDNIKLLREEFSPDFIIINGENLADGKGITEKTAQPLFAAGVSLMTSGNHLWDRHESLDYLNSEPRIIKPLNYPESASGNCFAKLTTDEGSLLVVCLTGQMFMPPCNSPYTAMENFHKAHDNKCIFSDFHAESTAEKRAFAHMFDGKISAVVGTHTHIQTADEEIMPHGLGYISDAGMTGPHDSVIGVKKHLIIEKMLTGMPVRYEVADAGLQINGVFLNIDLTSRHTKEIKRIRLFVD